MSRYDREFLGAHRYDVDDDRHCPVLIVGEDNPHGADPRHALYPYPPGCAGDRLADVILDVGSAHQLATWRTNLCSPRWSTVAARERARALVCADDVPWRVIVMLGRKVAEAFRYVNPQVDRYPGLIAPNEVCPPFTTQRVLHRIGAHPGPGRADLDWITLVSIPHPSGRCREWNFPSNVQRARALLSQVAPTWYGAIADA